MSHQRINGTNSLLHCLSIGLLYLASVSPAFAADLPGQRIDIGGHRLYIDCRGTGEPTVVIDAGMGGFSLEWRHVQEHLERQVRVCTYDRAGYGYSDPGPAPRTSARIAAELHELLHKAEIPGPYLLVGHSFGGYNIRYFASQYPDEVSGLVLVDASHPQQFERFPADTQRRQTTPTPPGGTRIWISRAVMPDNYPADLRQRAYLLMNMRKARQAQMEEFRSFMASATEVSKAPSLPDVPILVLSRGRQAWPETAHGDRMERIWMNLQMDLGNLSNHTLHMIAAESGHLIHFDQPEAVSQAVLLTVTAARSRWYRWEAITENNHGSLIAPMLSQSLYLAKR